MDDASEQSAQDRRPAPFRPSTAVGGELWRLSAHEVADLFRSRQLSPLEVTEATLARMEAREPDVNAFVTRLEEQALQTARAHTETSRHGSLRLGRLHGVPITVKDLTETAGIRTTFGSARFEHNVPDRDGLIWERLKDENPVLLGKTNTPEFGFLGVTENTVAGTTNNPWNLGRTVGGSSGGAAAAVAAGFGPLASGSDGGGSIRVPAACCGVVGMKPSRGRIPIYSEDEGFALADTAGPIARTVADVALGLSVLAGPDERDAFALPRSRADFMTAVRKPLIEGFKVAYCAGFGSGPIEPAVSDAIRSAAEAFERDLIVQVEEVEIAMPDPVEFVAAFWTPAIALLVDEGVGAGADVTMTHPVIRELAEVGRQMPATDHWRLSISVREAMHQAIADVFTTYDLLILPTMPMVAFPHPGPAGGPAEVAGKAVEHPFYYEFRFTVPFNHTGHPAISVPCGFDPDGLPIGLQIVGRHHADLVVLEAAAAWEEVASWVDNWPE